MMMMMMLQVSKWSLGNLILYTFLMILYRSGARAYNPLGTNFRCQQKALITLPICWKFKKKESDFIHIFNDFTYVYSPGARTDNPLETNFWCQLKALITLPICCKFKKKCYDLRFYIHFFHVSPYVYSPGQGQTIHWGQNFDDNRKAFSLSPYVASFKMISSKSDFMRFYDFIHIYSPKQKTPWVQTFDVNRKPLSLRPFVASFKQISLNSDFIHIF